MLTKVLDDYASLVLYLNSIPNNIFIAFQTLPDGRFEVKWRSL